VVTAATERVATVVVLIRRRRSVVDITNDFLVVYNIQIYNNYRNSQRLFNRRHVLFRISFTPSPITDYWIVWILTILIAVVISFHILGGWSLSFVVS